MKHIFLLLIVSALFSGNSYAAVSYKPHRAFQATYDIQSTYGHSKRILAYDGKGHARSEIIRERGGNNLTFLDLDAGTAKLLMENTHMMVTIPLHEDEIDFLGKAGEKFRKDGQSIGIRVIDGHPCHGWRYNKDGMTEEVWTADDIGIQVQSKVSSAKTGETTIKLVQYSESPDSSLFVIPAGYTEMPKNPMIR